VAVGECGADGDAEIRASELGGYLGAVEGCLEQLAASLHRVLVSFAEQADELVAAAAVQSSDRLPGLEERSDRVCDCADQQVAGLVAEAVVD
jgi:hypothetical protein